jgi:pimeloyl-ACP methyl ester carboxylesterase
MTSRSFRQDRHLAQQCRRRCVRRLLDPSVQEWRRAFARRRGEQSGPFLQPESFMSGAMKNHANSTYVLVAGAWHGGWIWRRIADGLRALGHTVTTPTLTGLGERRHHGQNADLDTHIEDVVVHIEMEDLKDVTLVGWSYGGMVITGALARIRSKVKAMIYLDAFVPHDGKALVDYMAPERLADWNKLKQEDRSLPPPPLESFGLTDPVQQNLVMPRLVNQPWRTLYQPVKALKQWPDIAIAYIYCSGERSAPSPFRAFMEEMQKNPKIRTETIATGHFPMLTEREKTVQLLDRYGG